jgi:integrase
MRPTIKLETKNAIEAVSKLKAEDDRYEVRTDLKGLLLVVHPKSAKSPGGIKTYVVQWARGKRKMLGHHPAMTPAAARVQALEVLRQVGEGGAPADASKGRAPKFNDFLDGHYASWVEAERKAGKATVGNLKAQFSELFGKKPLTDITVWSIEKFKAKRLKAGISPVTVNRDLDRIRALLNKAVEWNVLEVNPIAMVKRSKVEDDPRVRFLNAEEERRLREALAARELERRRRRVNGNAHAAARGLETRPTWAVDEYTDHLAPLVLVAMNTGLRRGELLGLTWEAVDRKAKRLKVTAATAKSQKVRYLPLNSEAAATIENLFKHSPRQTGPVFGGANGNAMTHVKHSWASLMAAAGLKNFHFHDLRHHFASKLVMAGIDLNTVRELLGHSDLKMTLRYAHLAPEHKAAAVEKLVVVQ